MSYHDRLQLFLKRSGPLALVLVLLFFLTATSFLSPIFNHTVVSAIQLIGGTFFLLIGTGVAVTLILQSLFQRKFDVWEFISLSLLTSLLIPPLLLELEFLILQSVHTWYPLLNTVLVWSIAAILLIFHKTNFPSPSLPKFSVSHPLFLSFLFGIVFVLIEISAFPTLPDLDPYKWLFKYEYQFANHLLDYTDRPLFGALTYIGVSLTGLEVFTFFKYLLPFFFLVTLFPAWMIAKTFSEKSKQWFFLLFIFSTPNILLYAGTAMPQVPLIILSYFFTFFLLHAHNKRDDFFLYISGLSMFVGFLYHQAAFIIFAAWLLPVAIIKRKTLLADKKILLLIALILLSNLERFQPMYHFVSYWVKNIVPKFFQINNINLFYPAQYSNIDHNMMGWPSLEGIIKYYSFYIGPVLGLVLILFFYLMTRASFRSFFLQELRKGAALVALLTSFGIFLIIAEILPRFPAIALLPDRAWIFGGIFSYLFLYFLLVYIPKVSRVAFLITILFIISISGALYINYLKRYLISPMQLESTQWIKTLSPNRVFLSYGHRNLLAVHANTSVVHIPSGLYCEKDINKFETILEDFNFANNTKLKQNFLEKTYQPFLQENLATTKTAYELLQKPSGANEQYYEAITKIDYFTHLVDKVETPLLRDKITIINPLSTPPQISKPIPNGDIFHFNFIPSLTDRPLYIYYSQVNTKNPYRSRPYGIKSWGMEPCPEGKFLFDQFPQKFERVYQAKDAFDEVIIWKVL